MTWSCLRCKQVHPDGDVAACSTCGWERDLTRRKQPLPIKSRIIALPSRSNGPIHLLTVYPDRGVACGTCKAGVHGIKCWAANELERRVRRRKLTDAWQLATIKERVFNVLHLYPDARNSDLALFRRYFELVHDLDPTAPWPVFLAFITRHYRGNALETIRRRRQEWQDAGLFHACAEVQIERDAKEVVWHDTFSRGASA